VAAAAKTFETWSEAVDCCGISAEEDDADQRAVNANPLHRLVPLSRLKKILMATARLSLIQTMSAEQTRQS
jgi:hypothetical protein